MKKRAKVLLGALIMISLLIGGTVWADGGLIAHYTFDQEDLDGETAKDVVGETDGVISGGPEVVPGKMGEALLFDGVDDYVVLGKEFMEGWGALTVEAWINIADFPHDLKVIGANKKMALEIDNPDDRKIRWVVRLAEWGWQTAIFSEASVEADVWYHLAAVYDGKSESVYIDGEKVATVSSMEGTLNVMDANMLIGAYAEGHPGKFSGIIDDVKIYDIALTDGEIRSHYAAPVAYYSLDAEDIEGDMAKDLAGGNDGVISGAPVAVDGKVGGALKFNGTDDYIDLGKDFMEGWGAWTVEAWVNIADFPHDLKVIAGGKKIVLEVTPDEPHKFSWGYRLDEWGWQQGVVSDTVAEAGKWFHLAATYNGKGCDLYINGVREAGFSAMTGTLNKTDEPMMIGAYTPGHPGKFSGIIDEVKIYDRELSADEIRYNYEGLIAYYPFDKGAVTAELAMDVVGGNDGIISGAPAAVAGIFGDALKFNGTDDFISLGKDFMEGWGSLTVEAWINIADFPHDLKVIGSDKKLALEIDNPDDKKVRWVTRLAEWGWQTAIYSEASVEAGVWYYLAATYDGKGQSLYINGQKVASVSAMPGTLNVRDADMIIGAYTAGHTGKFSGIIDEVKIFNRALSDDEIMDNYSMIAER